MNEIITGMALATVPLFVLGAVSFTRWRLWAVGPVVLVSLIVATTYGIIGWSDLWVLPTGLGMGSSLVLMVLWIVYGAVARTLGPVAIPGPAWVTAMLLGAGIGEIPAAAILSSGARTPKGAAKLALAAAGGGLIGRVGDPAMLILLEGHPSAMLSIAPLGIVLAWMARPDAEDLIQAGAVDARRMALVLGIGLVAAVPGLTVGALVLGIIGMGLAAQGRKGHVELGVLAWQIAALILAILAVAGGAPEQAATGLELFVETLHWWASPLLVAIAALLSALSDGSAMAIVCQAIVDRSMALDAQYLAVPMAVGVAVGGLAPLIAAGALKAGWKLWLIQVGVAVLWGCVWAWC